MKATSLPSNRLRCRSLLAAALLTTLAVALVNGDRAAVVEAQPPGKKTSADEPPENSDSPPSVPPPPEAGFGKETKDRGKLPWVKSGASRAAVVRPQITSARQLLVTLDDSQLNNFFDRQPLNANEDETLYRILYRLPNVGQHHVERLANRGAAWQSLVDDPAPHRIEIFKLAGRVKKVVRAGLLPEMAKRLEFDHYYRVTMQLDDAPNPVLICARSVPEAWLADEALDERASAFGMFLKVGDVSGPHPELVFVTTRVAWHPDRTFAKGRIGADQILLGDLGFDWGLIEKVRTLNAKRLVPEEREPFYQLLAAASRADEQEMARRGAGRFDLAALLQRPGDHHGDVMTLRGTARAIKRIEIGEPELRERLGFDHYFEVDLFVSLGDKEVRLTKAAGDKEGAVYTTGFPVVCCVVRLPDKWLRSKKIVGNDELKEDVQVTGFHYRLYAYESEFLSRFQAEHDIRPPAGRRRSMQPSPMFIAATVQPIAPPADPFPNAGWLVIGVIVMFVGTSALVVWMYNRSDRPIRAAARKRLTEIEDGRSLNDLNLDVRPSPPGPGK